MVENYNVTASFLIPAPCYRPISLHLGSWCDMVMLNRLTLGTIDGTNVEIMVVSETSHLRWRLETVIDLCKSNASSRLYDRLSNHWLTSSSAIVLAVVRKNAWNVFGNWSTKVCSWLSWRTTLKVKVKCCWLRRPRTWLDKSSLTLPKQDSSHRPYNAQYSEDIGTWTKDTGILIHFM